MDNILDVQAFPGKLSAMTEIIFFMGSLLAGCPADIFLGILKGFRPGNSGASWRGKIYVQGNEPKPEKNNEVRRRVDGKAAGQEMLRSTQGAATESFQHPFC